MSKFKFKVGDVIIRVNWGGTPSIARTVLKVNSNSYTVTDYPRLDRRILLYCKHAHTYYVLGTDLAHALYMKKGDSDDI